MAGGVARVAAVLAAVAAAACGRFGFETGEADGDGGAGGDGDGNTAESCAAYPDALFCDGFEGAGLEPWTILGNATRQTTIVHAGAGALRAETSMPRSAALAHTVAFAPRASGDLYARAWVYVPSGFDGTHLELFGLHASSSNLGFTSLVYGDTLIGWIQDVGELVTNSPPVPRDQWLCLELHVLIDDAVGKIRMWLDGDLAVDVRDIDTLQDAGYDKVLIGLPWTAETQPSAVALADDVVVAETPIGCSP